MFFDLVESRESVEEKSKCNRDEVLFTLNLVKMLASMTGSTRGLGKLSGKIAIITPYKAQVNRLKHAFGPWLK